MDGLMCDFLEPYGVFYNHMKLWLKKKNTKNKKQRYIKGLYCHMALRSQRMQLNTHLLHPLFLSAPSLVNRCLFQSLHLISTSPTVSKNRPFIPHI